MLVIFLSVTLFGASASQNHIIGNCHVFVARDHTRVYDTTWEAEARQSPKRDGIFGYFNIKKYNTGENDWVSFKKLTSQFSLMVYRHACFCFERARAPRPTCILKGWSGDLMLKTPNSPSSSATLPFSGKTAKLKNYFMFSQ